MKEVKIRTNRVCAYCEGTLPKGSLCYTYSKKYKGREWDAVSVCVSGEI